MLSRFGVVVPADQVKVENIAAVLVTAELAPYQRVGARLDVIASSIGDARSLQGGTLLPTSLRGPTGEMVALAQGPLSIGGFGGGSGGTSVQVNHLTVGRIPGGAIVEAAPRAADADQRHADVRACASRTSATASRVAQAINAHLGAIVAHAQSIPAASRVEVPHAFQKAVPELMAQLEALPGHDRRRRARRHQRAHGHGGRRRQRAARRGRGRARQPVGAHHDPLSSQPAGAVLRAARPSSCRISRSTCARAPSQLVTLPKARRSMPSPARSTRSARRRATSSRSCRRSRPPARSRAEIVILRMMMDPFSAMERPVFRPAGSPTKCRPSLDRPLPKTAPTEMSSSSTHWPTQFEAVLLGQMLREMRSSMFEDERRLGVRRRTTGGFRVCRAQPGAGARGRVWARRGYAGCARDGRSTRAMPRCPERGHRRGGPARQPNLFD